MLSEVIDECAQFLLTGQHLLQQLGGRQRRGAREQGLDGVEKAGDEQLRVAQRRPHAVADGQGIEVRAAGWHLALGHGCSGGAGTRLLSWERGQHGATVKL